MALFTRKQSREVAREIHKHINKGNKGYELMIVGNELYKKTRFKVLPSRDIFEESPKWDDYNLLFMGHSDIEFFSEGNMRTIQGIEDAVYRTVNIVIGDINKEELKRR